MQDNASGNTNSTQDPISSANPRLNRIERRLLEAFDELWQGFVDPDDAYYDDDGTRWISPSATGTWHAGGGVPYLDEVQLAEIRSQCRRLALSNEFAINGHENRISYIVGPGHKYRVVPRRGQPANEVLLAEVQTVVDEFLRLNKWHQRQQEIVRRRDRDGECLLRFFTAADGTTRVRFVEPDQVTTPAEVAGLMHHRFGIVTDPHDVETVEGYYVDGQLVPADEIQLRKLGVDANFKRGIPLYFPVRKNLRRAEKLLRNMSVVAEIQSAIALIRRHGSATAAGLEQFVADQADISVRNRDSAGTSHFRRYGPGTILDAATGTDYEFPVAGIDAGRYVTVLQAELRAVAARLVMPEFMLSSDASNANYASTMVAEGPAVKMFERMQHDMIVDDLDVMWRVVRAAVDAGRVPPDVLDVVDIKAIAPQLVTRDRLKEAKADELLVRTGAMSVTTMTMRHGLDPEQEQRANTPQT